MTSRAHEHFGISFESPVDLPHIATAARAPVVRVARGTVVPHGALVWDDAVLGERFRVHDGDGTPILAWGDWARLAIGQREVTVDAPRIELGMEALLGAGWTVLLAHHGLETIHGAGVALSGGTVGILGDPGAGKTTLSWSLVAAGGDLVADDLLVVEQRGLAPRVGSGVMRLRPDAAARAGVAGQKDGAGKFRTSVRRACVPPPLSLLICLTPEARQVERLSGAAAVERIRENFYNPVLTAPGQALRRFELAITLAREVPVLQAPERTLTPNDVFRLMEELCGSPFPTGSTTARSTTRPSSSTAPATATSA